MKFYFQTKVVFGFFLALSIIVWLGVSSYLNSQKYNESNAWVNHSNKLQFHAQRILSLITDIESGQRGFVITGDTVFLKPYYSGVDVVRTDLEMLRNLVRDDKGQLQRVDSLSKLVENKLAFAGRAIEARTKNTDLAVEAVATREGMVLMEQIRDIITAFQAEERRLLSKRSRITEEQLLNFSSMFAALMITTVAILVAVFFIINSNLKARYKAEQSLISALGRVQDMYDNAPCGYHSLDDEGYFVEINQTELDWLGYTRDEVVGKKRFPDILTPEDAAGFDQAYAETKVKRVIRDVVCNIVRKDGSSFPVILSATMIFDKSGKMVKTRSTVFDYTEKKLAEEKILQLNHELEAFTYSVSHDLRAPLRSIDGYARILSDDYGDHLDTEGQRVLGVIIKNANRMGRLIDDLLDFSRVGRKEISRARFSMEAMIQSAFDEVLENEKGRTLEFNVHDIADASADPHLIKQVWVNLISNAFKYSRKKEKSVVEITSQPTDKEVVYVIKDNGTGFDMQYVHKLFSVFQRLHKAQDFEGTGVGLAIVQRIISRHGGRVWAESELDNGASFYFSIPVEQRG